MAVLALGVWLKTDRRFRDFLNDRYRQVVTSDFDAPTLQIFAYIIIILAVCMILVSFFGCCGVVRESQILLILYFVCLVILFVVTLGCGIYLIIKKDAIKNEVADALTNMVQQYYQGPSVIQEALDAIQETGWADLALKLVVLRDAPRTKDSVLCVFLTHQLSFFRCCGSAGCLDFYQLRLDVPRSCDINCDGCQIHLYTALRQAFTVLAVVFVFVLLAQLSGMVLTMVLFFTVRDPKHRMLAYAVPAQRSALEPPQRQPLVPVQTQAQPQTSQAATLEKKIRPVYSAATVRPQADVRQRQGSQPRPMPPQQRVAQPRMMAPPQQMPPPRQQHAISQRAMPPPPYNARYADQRIN